MSPAVCGLFRPVILLPRLLAEQLPPSQLRAVLLHELIHLRRGDVWVNCLQVLLQVFYWWHPLLWIANARIRRVREEAVDDAVMLALRDDAETYAPTLLEVAKLAFNRPTVALGLVGIMEPRTALRLRIERLVNFDAPRKSGVTILSVVGVLTFSALAVPMEKAPLKTEGLILAQAKIGSPDIPPASQPLAIGTTLIATASNKPTSLTGRSEIVKKLGDIRMDRVFFDGESLAEVIRWLNEYSKTHDPDGKGVFHARPVSCHKHSGLKISQH